LGWARKEGRLGKRFIYFKKAQTIEFKSKFEFKQSKAMLQHECNN
jgi:hypothetical protein